MEQVTSKFNVIVNYPEDQRAKFKRNSSTFPLNINVNYIELKDARANLQQYWVAPLNLIENYRHLKGLKDNYGCHMNPSFHEIIFI